MGEFLAGGLFALAVEWLVVKFWVKPHQLIQDEHDVQSSDTNQIRLEMKVLELQRRLAAKESELREVQSAVAEGKKSSADRRESVNTAAQQVGPVPKASPTVFASEEPDAKSLLKIKGVGPKMADLLVARGLVNTRVIAASDQDALRQVAELAGPRFARTDVSAWIKQAALIEAGDLKALKKFQATLKP